MLLKKNNKLSESIDYTTTFAIKKSTPISSQSEELSLEAFNHLYNEFTQKN